jgi:16S rRNA (guanine527-N7)-methyltransferase
MCGEGGLETRNRRHAEGSGASQQKVPTDDEAGFAWSFNCHGPAMTEAETPSVEPNPSSSEARTATRDEALAPFHVSRETSDRLTRFIALLCERQLRMNLVASSTIPQVWTRHVADSLQLLALAPDARRWVDLGSGAGFPGIVIACALADMPGAHLDLVESIGKKVAFLGEAVAATGAPATVHHARIEAVAPELAGHVDIVTARALAPLSSLLTMINPFMEKGAKALLHKGQDVDAELTEAAKYWNIDYDAVPSQTDPRGRILVVRRLKRRGRKL